MLDKRDITVRNCIKFNLKFFCLSMKYLTLKVFLLISSWWLFCPLAVSHNLPLQVFIETNLVRACMLPETPRRLCCSSQQPLSWSSAWHWGNSDEWEKWTQPGRRWRQCPKPQPDSHPHLLWGQASWRLRSAPPEAPDPGADGCPGGWPWEMKGPLADGR